MKSVTNRNTFVSWEYSVALSLTSEYDKNVSMNLVLVPTAPPLLSTEDQGLQLQDTYVVWGL